MDNQSNTSHLDSENKNKIILCSNCFKDEGLKFNAILIGIENDSACPNCKSIEGRKLTKELIIKLCHIFLVKGSVQKFDYGGCPLIKSNSYHYKNSEINIPPWLKDDIE